MKTLGMHLISWYLFTAIILGHVFAYQFYVVNFCNQVISYNTKVVK